jgi:hypothetical protein
MLVSAPNANRDLPQRRPKVVIGGLIERLTGLEDMRVGYLRRVTGRKLAVKFV